MTESNLDIAIAALVRDLLLKFQPPEFIPGCVVQDVTNISDYTTNNGWIECLCGRHNQQRVRYKGFPINVAVDDVIDVVYYPSHKFFEVHGAGGATVTSADWVKISDLWESDFGAIAWSVGSTGNLSATGAYSITTTGDLFVGNIQASGNITLPNATAIVGSGSSNPDLGASASASRWGNIYLASSTFINALNSWEMSVGAIGSEVVMLTLVDSAQDVLRLGIQPASGDDVDINFSNGQLFLEGSSGKFGINTTTIPHGGKGAAMLALDGANASVNGPHIQLSTASQDDPIFQILAYTSDNVNIALDAYFDGTDWRSGSANSNFRWRKSSVGLVFEADTSIAVGSVITWDEVARMRNSGDCSFGGQTTPRGQVDVDQASTTAAQPVLVLDQADLSEEYIDFITASTGAGDPVDTVTAVGTAYARLRVAVNGTFKYIQLYNA